MPFPNSSTIASWIFYFIPVYIFVLAPLLQQLFPSDTNETSTSTWGVDRTVEYDAEGNEISPLNLEDDSFISPEDDRPLNCAWPDAYQVHILSREPLVIYIENLLSDAEADHLVDVR